MDQSGEWRGTLQRRLFVTLSCFACWGVAIEARLVYLQVVQHADLMARADRQQMRTIPAPPKRGEILDRHGRVLAYSVDADSIYAVPTEIDDPAAVAQALCAALTECADRERLALAERLSKKRPFAFVRRRVSPDEASRVAALNLVGVGFVKENRRYYPNKELAAHLVGYVGTDNSGLNGVEATFDADIRGHAGTVLIQTDARRRAFSRVERPPTSGATIELTIDEYLQHIAERELRAGVQANDAIGGTVIIMDPMSGELLAVANYPTFNPNIFAKYEDVARRNRAIQDIYEPGSTFKVVTASAALEEHVIEPADPVDVSAGMIRFGSRQIDDTHRYGVLSFTDVIVKSSNVGAIKVGLQLGAERLGRYVRRFGFGQALCHDFRGESSGIVWNPAQLNDSALASMSMGYQVGVTPLQMATAVSSVANGGELLEPRLVRASVREGKRNETTKRTIRRTISPDTAIQLREIMEAVVERGTAKGARLPGFTIAGKTGTSAKLVAGRYSKSDYNSSFVGFLPSRNPALTILVVIDSPHGHGYYGGEVAAPIFKRVAEESLRYLGIGPTLNAEPPLMVVRRAAPEEGPTPTRVGGTTTEAALSIPHRSDLMPDLIGLSAREAVRTLGQLGIGVRLTGDGLVAEQFPLAGTTIDQSSACLLRLSRVLPRLVAGMDQ